MNLPGTPHTPEYIVPLAVFLLAAVLGFPALAAEPGPIESIMPPPATLGAGWTRDTDLLMEDLGSPPQPRGNSAGDQLARQALNLGVPLFKSVNMVGNANFSYNLDSKSSFTVLDTYVSRFETKADTEKFWAEKITPRQGATFGVGDKSLLVDDGGASVLYFRTANFHIKIIVLGNKSSLKKLATLLDTNIRKASGG